jgi:hypothetical protein
VELPQAAAADPDRGADTGWQDVKDDIFGEEFLLAGRC